MYLLWRSGRKQDCRPTPSCRSPCRRCWRQSAQRGHGDGASRRGRGCPWAKPGDPSHPPPWWLHSAEAKAAWPTHSSSVCFWNTYNNPYNFVSFSSASAENTTGWELIIVIRQLVLPIFCLIVEVACINRPRFWHGFWASTTESKAHIYLTQLWVR